MIIDLCGRTRIKQRKAFDDGCIEGNAAAQWLLGCQSFSGIVAMRNKKYALRVLHKKRDGDFFCTVNSHGHFFSILVDIF